MNLHLLLQQLADGEFHSGSEIGALLGVSRTAVWKSLSRLSDIGIECESVKGKGYRLPYPLDLLEQEKILGGMTTEISSLVDLDVLLSIDSTNAYALGLKELSAPYQVCMAEYQTAGRGRRGRSWVSPFGRNIYMSLAFDLSGGAEALSGLSLVVGLAVVRALGACGLNDVKLKWPNDVWVDGKKICGILVELQGEVTTDWRVVVGLGLNVSMQDNDVAAGEIDQQWTSVDRHVGVVDRNLLSAKLIECLCEVLGEYRQGGFASFIEEWQGADALRGKLVNINDGNLSGVCEGVDGHGALLLRTESSELMAVNAGEVSVRCH